MVLDWFDDDDDDDLVRWLGYISLYLPSIHLTLLLTSWCMLIIQDEK